MPGGESLIFFIFDFFDVELNWGLFLVMWAGSAIHGLGLKGADFVRVFAMAKMLGIEEGKLSRRKV
jgi:hypothetical protein